MILIFSLSLTPGDKLPRIEWQLISVSTVAHFGFYFALVLLMLYGFLKNKPTEERILNLSNLRLYCVIVLVAFAIGYAIELIQGNFIYQRYYDPEDVAVNGIGTIFGGLGYTLIGRKIV
ncbi:MAG: VanZ family protein [Crocinitomicaceae bacterium]|nr:VanZ family protein [Crocinitomicaceae bacterium]